MNNKFEILCIQLHRWNNDTKQVGVDALGNDRGRMFAQ